MHGGTDGWVDGWTDGRMDGQLDGPSKRRLPYTQHVLIFSQAHARRHMSKNIGIKDQLDSAKNVLDIGLACT